MNFKTGRPGGRVRIGIMGALFLLIGGTCTYLFLIRPLAGVVMARHWTETTCRVLSSEVKSHSGDGTTYSVNIRYAYTVAGQQYESNRYDFMGGSSSGYEGKAKIVRRYAPGTVARCFVNPRSPAEAVLQRGFTPVMLIGLFPLLFVLIGSGLLVAAVRKPATPAPAAGSTPWLTRPDWAAGVVKSSEKAGLLVIWGFAVVWNAIAFPVLFLIGDELHKSQNKGIWMVLVFPLAGVGLLALAVYSTLKWRKFGTSVFEMASVPGVIGGALEGKIRLSQFVRPEAGFKVKLQCLRRYVSGSDQDRHESILWEEERPASGGGGTDSLPVLFAIPADLPETNVENPNSQIVWRLSASARLPGVDYATQFEVPVFKTAQTPAQAAAAQRAQASERTELAAYRPPLDSPIRVQPALGGGTEFYFPAARNVSAATGLTAFTLLWSGALWLQFYFKAPIIFPIVTGLFELLLVAIVINLWFRSTRIVASAAGLTITSGLLGWARTRMIPASEISGITTKVGMTAGTTSYQDIKVALTAGRSVTAGGSIRDGQEVRWLAAEMSRCLELDHRPSR